MAFKNKKQVDFTSKSFVIAFWYDTAHYNQWIFRFLRITVWVDKWDAELLKCHFLVYMCTVSFFIFVFEWRGGEGELGPKGCNSYSIKKKFFHFCFSLDMDSKKIVLILQNID